jgi:transposase-like protein
VLLTRTDAAQRSADPAQHETKDLIAMAVERAQADAMPAMPVTIYKCPHCRSEYELIMAHLSFRQRSYANCQVCNKTMYSWNSSHVPRFTLAKPGDAKFAHM